MKKKIINGILMSALLLAGTTSFVSCKDNVTDTKDEIYVDLNALNQKLASLQDQVNKIPVVNPYDDSAIKKELGDLKSQIEQIQKDIEALQKGLDGKADKSSVEALEKRIADLEEAIKNWNKTVISPTGVVLQETLDRVVGTINLPGFNPAFLAAYVGENKNDWNLFPVAGDDYNVIINGEEGNYLKNSEICPLEDRIHNRGSNSYLVNGTGNAGKLYFTINPRQVDPTLCQFDLINSTGEVSPIQLSNVQPSNHVITFAIGKHGNGMTRDAEYGDADAVNADIASQKVYLYEADATVALEGIEKIHFDYTKFGYQNLWDAGKEMLGVTQSPDANAQNMFGRFTYLAQQVKAKNVENVLEASLKILQDFYNGVYSQRNKLQKQALRVSWADGENDVISGFDITTVTINPLNWKQMVLFDQMNPRWNVVGFNAVVTRIVKAVQAKLPNVNNISVNLFPNGTTIEVKNTTAITATATVGGVSGTTTIPAGTTLATIDLNDYINTKDIKALEDQVNALLKPYNSVKNATGAGVMTRVNNYLNKVTDKVILALDGMPAWRLTEPTLLFESNYGISRLEPYMNLQGAEKFTFIMTSMTEEYIVPVYLKYIAVLYGGKIREYHVFPGSEKIVQLEIPNEQCEIIYQASDFYGNIVTKRYPLNVGK